MSVDIAVLGDEVPGGGPTDKEGAWITVPVPTTGLSVSVVTVACLLGGYSFRESTGTAGAVCELLDGGDDNGSLIAALALTAGFDPAASQTPTDNTATGAAAAIAATLTAAAGQQLFLNSLRIEGLGATAATEVQATLTGVLGGTITYPVNVPAGVLVPIAPVTDSFPGRGLQGVAAGTNIVLNVPSFGAGNTFAEAELQGYIVTAAGAADTRTLPSPGLYVQSTLRLRVVSGSVRGAVWIKR